MRRKQCFSSVLILLLTMQLPQLAVSMFPLHCPCFFFIHCRMMAAFHLCFHTDVLLLLEAHGQLVKAPWTLPICAAALVDTVINDAEVKEPQYLNSCTCSIDASQGARLICCHQVTWSRSSFFFVFIHSPSLSAALLMTFNSSCSDPSMKTIPSVYVVSAKSSSSVPH